MRAPASLARWNPAPANCFTARRTLKRGVCLHHMAGFAPYMRTFAHLRRGRRISAHFTIAADGSIEQHVDTDHVAWTQGVRKVRWPLVQWPLFADRNPNIDLIGVEMENGLRPWSAEHPMPEAECESLGRLLRWCRDNVIESRQLRWEYEVTTHSRIAPKRKPNDPPEWWVREQLPGILSRIKGEDQASGFDPGIRTLGWPIPAPHGTPKPASPAELLERRVKILERRVDALTDRLYG